MIDKGCPDTEAALFVSGPYWPYHSVFDRNIVVITEEDAF